MLFDGKESFIVAVITRAESLLLPSAALIFQHTLSSAAILQLQEEIYHLKKQRQIFDLDDYPAGVSSSPWCRDY